MKAGSLHPSFNAGSVAGGSQLRLSSLSHEKGESLHCGSILWFNQYFIEDLKRYVVQKIKRNYNGAYVDY